ncbi:PaaI family thioesterase [Roseovarius sp. BRH_c41]|uniref:PaaI family thioesterase n=1 Tax=Roseovarius sp. BRH_c41 TaxID=1629709 RepID=UPI000A780D5F|nr:PaaI family thioesterase [Roseovarius sp. BRH_c41]
MISQGSVEADTESTSPSEPMEYTGFELVSAWANGSIRPPAMADVMPFTLLPPQEGEVTLRARPEARFSNPMKTMHGGWIMTMLDTAMALAAQTTLAPGEACPSHETTTKFIRPILAESGEMKVIGRVLSRGQMVITLEGRVEDAGGRLHAHGTSTCLIVRSRP